MRTKTYIIQFVLILVVGCTPIQNQPPKTDVPVRMPEPTITSMPTMIQPTPLRNQSLINAPVGWESRWLEKQPCPAPCWENITPGITTMIEAESILQKNAYMYDIRKFPRAVSWKILNHSGQSLIGIINTETDGEQAQIASMYPPVGFVQLARVIEAYGQPSHIEAYAGTAPDIGKPPIYEVRIIYMNYGILLRINEPNGVNIKPDISPTTSFGVFFFIPTVEGFKRVTNRSITAVTIQKWDGYKSFDEYCLDEYGGIYCKGSK